MIAAALTFAAIWWVALTAVPVGARRHDTPPPRHHGRHRWLVAIAVTAAGVAVLGPIAGVLAGGGLVLHRWAALPRARATLRRQRHSLPDAVDLLVLAVRAGHTPSNALRAAVAVLPDAVRPAFVEVVRRVDGGARFADALHALVEQLGPPAEPLVDALSSAERYGLPLAPVLDRLAGEARAARRQQADAAARELPVRLAAPLVLCTLPSFVLLAIVPLLLGTFSSLR